MSEQGPAEEKAPSEQLESLVRAAAESYDYPPTPPLAARVRAQLEHDQTLRGEPQSQRFWPGRRGGTRGGASGRVSPWRWAVPSLAVAALAALVLVRGPAGSLPAAAPAPAPAAAPLARAPAQDADARASASAPARAAQPVGGPTEVPPPVRQAAPSLASEAAAPVQGTRSLPDAPSASDTAASNPAAPSSPRAAPPAAAMRPSAPPARTPAPQPLLGAFRLPIGASEAGAPP